MRITPLLGCVSASVACCLLACSAGLSDDEDSGSLGSAVSSPDGTMEAAIAVQSQWGSGYCADVTVTNTSDSRTTAWGVVVGLNGSTMSNAWNARVTASNGQLNAANEIYNGALDKGASVTWGFCASGTGKPALVAVSGGGGSGASASASSSSSSSSSASSSASSGAGSGGAGGAGGGGAGGSTSTGGGAGGSTSTGGGAGGSTGSGCGVPTSFEWTSSPPLITPPSGSVSIKDPTVLFHDGKWHVYATHYASGYNMTYLNFTDWNQAGSAPKTLLSTNPNLTGYKCAPQLFYFAPQKLWYLVYQTQPPAYSTSTNPSDVRSWSPRRHFIANEPEIVTRNKGSGPGWIDFWVICDDASCYLFFSDDNGHLYRSKTSKASFPNGFGTPVIALSDSRFALFEAANIYKMKGTDKYLLIHEAIGDGRYFRSWTADKLDGAWTPLAATQANPFASKNNVTGAGWSNDGISHGEMLRDNPDETMTIDTCNMRYLFQGRTRAGSSYDLNEYSLGLLTAVP